MPLKGKATYNNEVVVTSGSLLCPKGATDDDRGLRFVPLRLPFGRIVAPKGQNGGDKERRTPLKGTKGVSPPVAQRAR